MATRDKNPDDLPSGLRLFRWTTLAANLIGLDANNKVATLTDKYQGRVAYTDNATYRRTLSTFNNVTTIYKAGTSANTDASGMTLKDLSGLPVGSADRYLYWIVQHADGVLGGYGDSNRDYWLDTPYNPGYRVHLDGVTTTSQVSVDRTTMHFVSLKTVNGTTYLRVDGVDAGTFTTAPKTTANMAYGLIGHTQNFYPMLGNFVEHGVLLPPGSDNEYFLEAWAAKNITNKTPPNDNPYRPVANGGSGVPQVSDGGSAVAPDNATQAQTATSPTLASRAGVQPDSAMQAATASSPSLPSRSTVTPDSASHASTASSPSLVSRSAVTPDNAAQQQAATSPILASRGSVAPDSATQATQASSPSLSNVRTAVAPDSATQAQAVTQPSLAGAGTVGVDSATQAQTVSSPTVAARSSVQPASANQAQTTTSPSLNGRQTVAPDNATQASMLSSPTVAARATLTPNSASQQQVATSPPLAAKAFLLVTSALQAQAATSPALFVGARPLPPSTRTARSIRFSRVARSSRPSRLAA